MIYKNSNHDATLLEAYSSQNLLHAIDPEVVRDAETKVATAYACIRLVSTAISEAPVEEYIRTEKGKSEEVDGSRIREILEEPNPEQSGPEFLYTMTSISAICDYCLIEHVRDRAGRTAELYPRVPIGWTRRKSPGGRIYWEAYGKDGRRREVKVEDITVMPYEPHPKLKGYGISPLKVISRESGIENLLTAYLLTYLERGAIISHVLTTDQPIYDPAHIARMQIQMQRYQAGGGLDTIPVFPNGIKLTAVGNSIDEMALPDLRGISELKICQGFGVQPHLVGAKDAITNGGLATTELKEAMRFFQTHTIAPLRRRQAGTLTRGILRPEQPDRRHYLGYNLKNVAALQEDRNAQHVRELSGLTGAAITVDEFRIATGREALPNDRGNVRLIPFNLMEVPIDEEPPPVALPPKPPLPGKTTIRALPMPGESLLSGTEPPNLKWIDLARLDRRQVEIRNSALRTNRNRQEQLTRQFLPKQKRFFREQKERLIGNLSKAGTEHETRDFEDVPDAIDIVDVLDAIDWYEEKKEITELLGLHYERTGKKAIADVNMLIGSDAIWEVGNPEVAKVWEQLGDRIVGISETTRIDVTRIINESLAEGVTLPELSTRIEHLFEETYNGRALAIARTETQAAYNLASASAYMQTGEVDEVELHDNPNHIEEYGASDGLTCAQRDGLIVPVGNTSKHVRAEHPNGSLAVSPIVRPLDAEGNPISPTAPISPTGTIVQAPKPTAPDLDLGPPDPFKESFVQHGNITDARIYGDQMGIHYQGNGAEQELAIINSVNEGYHTLGQRGYKGLADRVVMGEAEAFGGVSDETMAIYNPNTDTIYINSFNAEFWEDPEKFERYLDLGTTGPGWWAGKGGSSSGGARIFIHEQGHMLHYKELGAWPVGDLTKAETAAATKYVSRYAATEPAEFVAEVFTGLNSGIKYPKSVMKIYERLGGPTV